MPPKAKVAAPIDRPLSRAYLREFTGWSTAYPPGLSDPTSLRIMENLQINRDGSARVRPGLKYLSYATPPAEGVTGVATSLSPVGTHEPFFLNNGDKAYLFAVREADGKVGFRVLHLSSAGPVVKGLTASGIEFDLSSSPEPPTFTAATTYVKYLQIDNRIFALSNAGEPMKMFYVGTAKKAVSPMAIGVPTWSVDDKLTVIHPDGAWVSGSLTVDKLNLITNPSFETDLLRWSPSTSTNVARTTGGTKGSYAAKLTNKPVRTNLMPSPLSDPSTNGWPGWSVFGAWAPGGLTLHSGDNMVQAASNPGWTGTGHIIGPEIATSGETSYRIAYNSAGTSGTSEKVMVRFYGASGTQIGPDRVYSKPHGYNAVTVTTPVGGAKMRVFPRVEKTAELGFASIRVGDFLVNKASEAGTFFDGSSGAGFRWGGTPHNSVSYEQSPVKVSITSDGVPVVAGEEFTGSASVRTVGSGLWVRASVLWFNGSTYLGLNDGAVETAPGTGDWVRPYVTATAPATATAAKLVIASALDDVDYNEELWVDGAMFNSGALESYYDGSYAETPAARYSWTGTAHGSASQMVEYVSPLSVPSAETPTVNTLISSTAADNDYSVGFFYTFHNQLGESAPSQVTVVKVQRAWSAWKWETPNAAGEPSGTYTPNQFRCADQLVAVMPSSVLADAVASGATGWNLYATTWSDQSSVPVMAVKIATRELLPSSTHAAAGWLQMTPAQADAGSGEAPLPSEALRYNYSDPSRAGQGVVAGDRMVLVYDPTAAAVVKWSGNLQGDYSNFTATAGGGYKTLTSGNLYVPAAVKLWQNPESKDTLTILCQGVDGHSVSYYMAPSSVSSQSGNTIIMGFEETTATPGTVSPYGCEVFNNALYHPLETELMKSTAANYNINHKSQTDDISNMWIQLQSKERIVSSQLDRRLYYLVYNPMGPELEEGCWANELWVLDGAEDTGSWSRWLVQGSSLRKIEVQGRTHMSLVRPDGIFYFDDKAVTDEYVDPDTLEVLTRDIPWRLETNTQGANRAHDAWAHLRQVSVILGNFRGTMRWGVRGLDLNGKRVDKSKITQDAGGDAFATPFDINDHLQVARDMMEWVFYAESVDGKHSEGQVSAVQYRYTPISVNVGYEYGSVETFEYQRNVAVGNNQLYTDGTTTPMLDRGRP